MLVEVYRGSRDSGNKVDEIEVPDLQTLAKYNRKYYRIDFEGNPYIVLPKGGRPTGIPREGNYGTGVKTKVVRVPEAIADNIEGILKTFEQIKTTVDCWEETIEENSTSPRYYHAKKLLAELRQYLGE